MSFLRAVGRFCYDLVIGDDWKIAAAVVAALGAAAILATSLPALWRAPAAGLLLAAAFTAALLLDTRRGRS